MVYSIRDSVSRKSTTTMPASKSLTPAPADHPAQALQIGDQEDVQTLLKLTPVVLPNVATLNSLAENYPGDKRWTTFREDFRYIYVNNWMYQCRGYIKLALDHFDADLFEIELFDLVHPPPLDELQLLVNRAKIALLSKIHGKKIASLGSFESLFRIYFGSETPLGGPDEEDANDDVDQSLYPRFDDLYIDQKYEILYLLMAEVSLYADFRDFIDKQKLSPDQLRAVLVSQLSRAPGQDEDYILALDNTALYKRSVAYPELVVPKKRKLAPQWPEDEYEPEKFDAANLQYKLVFRDVYGLDKFIKELLPNKKSKKNRALLDVIHLDEFVDKVFSYEIKKRRILSHKRKDLEMARLLATRKRSLRLEAKEKQREIEEQERKAREYEELQYAASRRRSQRARLQMQTKLKMDYTAGLTREQRFNLRAQKIYEDRIESAVAESKENNEGTEQGTEQETEQETEQGSEDEVSNVKGEESSNDDVKDVKSEGLGVGVSEVGEVSGTGDISQSTLPTQPPTAPNASINESSEYKTDPAPSHVSNGQSPQVPPTLPSQPNFSQISQFNGNPGVPGNGTAFGPTCEY